MTDNPPGQPAGWYHAQGDPPGTHRYWDGFQWQGGPQPVASSVSTGYGAPTSYSGAMSPAGRPATYGSRAIAVLIDSGIAFGIYIVGLILAAVLGAVSEALGTLMLVVTFLASFGFFIWNYVILQGSTGQTLGKRQQSIELVADKDGRPVGAGMALIRWIVAAVLGFACGIGTILDYLWPLWDDDNKRLTDKILNLNVVKAGERSDVATP